MYVMDGMYEFIVD